MGEDANVEPERTPSVDVRERAPMEESGVRLYPQEDSPYPVELLDEGVLVESIAKACRMALRQFLTGVDAGWGKAEFETWVERTRMVVGGAAAGAERVGRAHRGSYAQTARARQCNVNEELFRRLLEDARATIVSVLENAAPPARDSSFAVAAIRRGFVVQARDEDGREGWVPVDVPGMWPVERLMALVAADYLTRPADYEVAALGSGRAGSGHHLGETRLPMGLGASPSEPGSLAKSAKMA